jgi:hypothetical protein
MLNDVFLNRFIAYRKANSRPKKLHSIITLFLNMINDLFLETNNVSYLHPFHININRSLLYKLMHLTCSSR